MNAGNTVMELPRLQEHLNNMHADKKIKELSYFQGLERKYLKQPTTSNLFASSSKQ